jgi:hypothetical protein
MQGGLQVLLDYVQTLPYIFGGIELKPGQWDRTEDVAAIVVVGDKPQILGNPDALFHECEKRTLAQDIVIDEKGVGTRGGIRRNRWTYHR